MGKIKLDKRNYRKHNAKNKNLIKKSLSELGAGRSVLMDNDEELIAGNGVYEQAEKLGMKIRVVESDGKELIVVKRTDLKRNSDKRKKLALADNSISDTSEFDHDILHQDFSVEELNEFGIDAEQEKKVTVEKKETEPFKRTHILFSFHPSKLIDIQALVEKIKEMDGIEYEQSSN